MKISSWNGVTGNWRNAGNWSNGVPRASKEADITVAGSYTVNVKSGSTAAAAAVVLDATGATLAVGGSLSVGGTFDLKAGTLALAPGGVLHAGTLVMDGGALSSQGGTLDGVNIVGPLVLSADFESLLITNGLTATASGGGAGLITLRGEDAYLDFIGNQTFNNATLVFDNSTIFGAAVIGTGVLTFGANAILTTTDAGPSATIGGKTVINNGTFIAAASHVLGSFTINATNFVNNGLIEVDELLQGKDRSFSNGATGVMNIGNGANAWIDGAFVNHGAISVGAGSNLFLLGSYSLADLGVIANSGSIDLRGTLLNQGSTITLGAGALAGNVLITGVVSGGTVVAGANGGQLQGATLDGVTYQGNLNLGGNFSALTVTNGLSVVTAQGNGRGKVFITGAGAALMFDGSQTLDNAVVHLGGGGVSGDSLVVLASKGHETTLTLGANLTVVSDTTGDAHLTGGFTRGVTHLVNDGTILAASFEAQFQIATDTFTNNGQIFVVDGEQLSISSGIGITNAGTISVESGKLTIGQGNGNATFSNTGVINVSQLASLTLSVNFTVASLGNIVDAGVFVIGGTLDNSGQTLQLGTGPIFGGVQTVLGGDGLISGGVVSLGTGNLAYNFGHLANLTFEGAVDLGTADTGLNLDGGVVFTGADGTGPGVINLTGARATLQFYDPTGVNGNGIDNVTINVGNATGADTIDILSYGRKAQTLTLGAGTNIISNSDGAQVVMTSQFLFPDILVSHGNITAAAAGGIFTATFKVFENDGHVTVSNGDTFVLNGELTGTGQISVGGGGVVSLGAVGAHQTVAFADSAGTLKLTGPASFAATISDATIGDVIDLINTSATAANVNSHDQLVITNNGATVATLQLVGDYSHTAFNVGGDGAGGTAITLAAGPSVQGMSQAMAGLGGSTAAIAAPAAAALLQSPMPMLARTF